MHHRDLIAYRQLSVRQRKPTIVSQLYILDDSLFSFEHGYTQGYTQPHSSVVLPEQQGNRRPAEGKRGSRCALPTHELDEKVTRLIRTCFNWSSARDPEPRPPSLYLRIGNSMELCNRYCCVGWAGGHRVARAGSGRGRLGGPRPGSGWLWRTQTRQSFAATRVHQCRSRGQSAGRCGVGRRLQVHRWST